MLYLTIARGLCEFSLDRGQGVEVRDTERVVGVTGDVKQLGFVHGVPDPHRHHRHLWVSLQQAGWFGC